MRFHSIGRLAAVVGLAVAIGCAGEEQAEGGEEGRDEDHAMPDTTAAAVWAHLEAADYQSWALWPGKDRLYSGGEPHGMLLTTYVNGEASEALAAGAAMMPAGAIIVKENYMPDSMLAAVTVMYKTESFNPDHNNWFFIKRLSDGTVEVDGRGAGCEGCHGAARDNDYLLTALPM